MLNLRSVVKNLPALAKSIEGAQSRLLHFLNKVHINLYFISPCFHTPLLQLMSDSRLADIEQEIEKHLNDDATVAKVGPEHQSKNLLLIVNS